MTKITPRPNCRDERAVGSLLNAIAAIPPIVRLNHRVRTVTYSSFNTITLDHTLPELSFATTTKHHELAIPKPSRHEPYIEHASGELGSRVRLRNNQNANNLEQALVAKWNAVPQHFFQRLCNSMRSRCQTCVVARGGQTQY